MSGTALAAGFHQDRPAASAVPLTGIGACQKIHPLTNAADRLTSLAEAGDFCNLKESIF